MSKQRWKVFGKIVLRDALYGEINVIDKERFFNSKWFLTLLVLFLVSANRSEVRS